MEFRILGPVEARHDDGHRLPVRGAKQRALLALLLLHANEAVSSERLVDELWGERPPATAAKALHVYVSQLRKLLEPERAAGAPSRLLESSASGYRLRIEPDQLDLHRFENLLARGRRALAGTNPGEAARLLGEALALWRGAALADLPYEPFAQAEIARLDELRLAAIEERIEAELQLGRHAELIAELEALVSEHPLRERLRARLMLALYRSGRQVEALEAYQQARRTLVDELGIEPGKEQRELEQAILRQDPALELPSVPAEASTEPSRGTFVGREGELDELQEGLEEALRGHGGLYLLVGQPGIGKSRLAEELIDRARARGAEILIGRCWEAGGAPAYWPWVQSLRAYVRARDPDQLRAEVGDGAPELAQLVPELRELFPRLTEPQSPESEGARFRLFDAVATFLKAAAQARPLVLVLDDLHAADEPSLLLLQFLAREVTASRLLVVAAYRDVDPTPRDPLAAALGELRREPTTHRIALEGLAEPAVAEYVEVAAGRAPAEALVAAIHAETEGNPLFVGEVVRLLAAEDRLDADDIEGLAVPDGVREVIGRRLRFLSPECNSVLTLASVLGREFDLNDLARVSAIDRDGLLGLLDEAIDARVVSEIPGTIGRFRFAHALIRDVVYEALTSARRVRLHRAVGEALENLYSSDPAPRLAELAHHFFEAVPGGHVEKAKRYAVEAAERSVGLLAFEEAVRLYRLALRLSESETERCELLIALGETQARAGDTASAKEFFHEGADLADVLGLPEQLARAALGYGGRITFDVSRDDDYLVTLLEGALTAIGDEDSTLRVRLLARLAGGPLRDASFPPERRVTLSKEALEIARRIGDPATLAYALTGYISSHLSPSSTQKQVELATELIEVAMGAGDRERALEGHESRQGALVELGEVTRAKADHAAMAKLADELRQPSQGWYVAVYSALFALLEGRLAEAEKLISDARSLGERAHSWIAVVSFRLQLYVLRWEQGRLEEVQETVRRSVEEYPTYPIWRCVLAHMVAELGDEDKARETLEAIAADDFAGVPFDEEWLVSLGFLTETVRLLADARAAAVLYGLLFPYADRVAVSYPDISTGSVAHYLGILALTTGNWREAALHFEQALEVNERIGARPWLAHTQHEYGLALLRRGGADSKKAQKLLDQALGTYRELGMESHAARISAGGFS